MQTITQSGGLIELVVSKSGLIGPRLILHIDQTLNIRNGEGDASIALTCNECKDVIAGLNEYVKLIEGKDYVYTSDSIIKLLSHPEIQDKLEDLEKRGEIEPRKEVTIVRLPS